MSEQLSPIESIMWRVGHDPTLRMTVGALVILDRPPSLDALAACLGAAAERAPRLRRRPEDATGVRGRPDWVDDDDHDPRHHLRTLSVAAPGDVRQVLDLAALIESVPFDPERSPWDVTSIEGLDGGRGALYLRAHHVVTDGVGGIRLLGLLLDEPGWPAPSGPPPPHRRRAVRTTGPEGEAEVDGGRRPGTLTVTIDLPRLVRRVMEGVSAARDVDAFGTAVKGAQQALDVANSVSRQLVVTGGPMSERPPARSLLSRFDVLSIEGTREAALALGGSRNDLLVAATAAGLGAYYEQQDGRSCPELRLATPAGQRRDHEVGGNWFAPTRLDVPTSVGRPGPQFGVVVERLAQARREPALRVAASLAATIGRLPTRLLLPALHAQAESVDFAATALPGLRGTRHLAGARIESSYPLGPRLGCPMNVTAFGNDDRLDIGLAVDPVALDDPDLLLACLRSAFEAVLASAPQATRRG